jgi:hypothetical protein
LIHHFSTLLDHSWITEGQNYQTSNHGGDGWGNDEGPQDNQHSARQSENNSPAITTMVAGLVILAFGNPPSMMLLVLCTLGIGGNKIRMSNRANRTDKTGANRSSRTKARTARSPLIVL